MTETIKRTKSGYYDPKFQSNSVTVLPGEYFTTEYSEDMLVTLLGSCVAACIRDPIANVGGLNHFLLAEPSLDITSPSNRYGSFAMECLINEILKKGGIKNRLEAKVFGGSDLFNSRLKIGQRNSEFVKKYLFEERIPIISEDLGGQRPRRIHYWPATGRVMRLVLQQNEQKTILNEEQNYRKKVSREVVQGDIELF